MEGTLFFAPDIHSKHPAPTGVEGAIFLEENMQKKLLTFLVLTIFCSEMKMNMHPPHVKPGVKSLAVMRFDKASWLFESRV